MSRHDDVLRALRSSAKVITESNRGDLREKTSPADFVTQADQLSQDAARSVLGDNILSEEDPASHTKINDPAWSGWVLDPLDGTNNFSRGIPYYCISLAWVERGEPLLGGVLDPLHGELWFAEKGEGATLNGKPIATSREQSFHAGTRVVSSNSYEKGETLQNMRRYEALGNVWVDFRSSLALDIVYVASGRLDLLHHQGLYPWDSAAALLIASEAGAKTSTLSGAEATWRDRDLLVGNEHLVEEFLRLQQKG